jgi:hypothetical protein
MCFFLFLVIYLCHCVLNAFMSVPLSRSVIDFVQFPQCVTVMCFWFCLLLTLSWFSDWHYSFITVIWDSLINYCELHLKLYFVPYFCLVCWVVFHSFCESSSWRKVSPLHHDMRIPLRCLSSVCGICYCVGSTLAHILSKEQVDSVTWGTICSVTKYNEGYNWYLKCKKCIYN